MDDLETIIPLLGKAEDFRAWNAADDLIDWESYHRILGRVEEAIYWSRVFAPKFIELNGMVLRQRWQGQYPTVSTEDSSFLLAPTRTQSEFLANHLHISDLFYNDPHRSEYDEKVYLYVAHYIAGSWHRILREQFPEKEFDVGVDEAYGDIQVYAVTVRNDD